MNSVINWLKTNWQLKAMIAGAALVILSLAAIFMIAGLHDRGVTKAPASVKVPAAAANPAASEIYADLYAVSIDNQVDARPASGLSQAAFVYEAPVEGDITRFLAVFERKTEVKEIGPVRSARPYLLDWVLELGPSLFLHFGGSPEALDRIATTPALNEANRDGMGNAGNGFWRDEARDMPHNAYTSSANVEKMFSARAGGQRNVTGWLMAADPDLDARGPGLAFTVPVSSDPNYRPEWRYDHDRNVYARYVRNKQVLDRDGRALEAKNVIVMETAVSKIDSVGRLKVAVSGSGPALVYRNGEALNATWKNEAGGALTRFYAADGSEIALTQGNVWIEVVNKK